MEVKYNRINSQKRIGKKNSLEHPRSMRSRGADSQTTDFAMFVKIILTVEDMKQKLRMPLKFVRYHGNELSYVVKLILPDGKVWQVGLRKSKNETFFEKDWPKFVEYYSISHGSFVIFRYIGGSHFVVYIVDLSCCEIRYPSDETRSNQELSHETGDSSHGSDVPCSKTDMPEPPIKPPTKGKAKIITHTKAAPEKLDQEEKTTVEVIDKDGPGGSETKKSKKKRKPRLDEAEFATKTKDINGEYKKDFVPVKPYKLAFASPESRRAVEEAEKLETQNPHFIVLLSEYDMIKYKVYVPTKFAKKYLRRAGDRIQVQGSHGRQWLLRFTRQDGKYASYYMNAGWGEFSDENNLKDGDVLVFELLDREDVTMKVTIFRAV